MRLDAVTVLLVAVLVVVLLLLFGVGIDFEVTIDLRVICYNVGNAGDGKVADDLDKLTQKPGVVGLCEVGDRNNLGRKGWHLVKGDEQGRGKVAVLVHNSLGKDDQGYFHLTNPTHVGKCHSLPDECCEKWIAWVRIKPGGGRKLKVGMLHLVPGVQGDCQSRGKRRDLHKKQVKAALDWENDGDALHIIMGDWNATHEFDGLDPLRNRGLKRRSANSHGQRDIDQHWFHPAGWISSDDAVAMGGYSSDHKPVKVVYKIQPS